jgi:dihydroorotate dehydrogenase
MGRLESLVPQDRLPVFVGAGVVKEKAQVERLAPEETIAALILGSYTQNEHGGNDNNGQFNVFWWDEPTRAAYNSIGLRNPGKENASRFLPEALKIAEAAGQLAIVSVTTLKGEDPEVVLPELAEWALQMGAPAVEFNGSCPNLDPSHPLLCNDTDKVAEVIANTRERVGHGAIIGFKVSDLPAETIAEYAGLQFDFYDTVNTKGNQPSPVNPATGRPAIEVNNGLAGQSGPIIRELARENLLRWRHMISESGDGEDILSIGGVGGGFEVYDRVHNLGALMVGGAQEFYRASDPRQVGQSWAMQYA